MCVWKSDGKIMNIFVVGQIFRQKRSKIFRHVIVWIVSPPEGKQGIRTNCGSAHIDLGGRNE